MVWRCLHCLSHFFLETQILLEFREKISVNSTNKRILVPIRTSTGLRRRNGGTCRLYQRTFGGDMLNAVENVLACPPVCPPICLPARLSVRLFSSLSVCSPSHPLVCTPVCLPTRPPFCTPVFFSACLPTPYPSDRQRCDRLTTLPSGCTEAHAIGASIFMKCCLLLGKILKFTYQMSADLTRIYPSSNLHELPIHRSLL